VYGLSIGEKSGDLKVNFGLLFWKAVFFHKGYPDTFCHSAAEFGRVMCLANRNLFPEFRELWFRGPVVPSGDMH